jgi:hypothetical protein
MTRILVHIDKLILRGVADGDADALADEISRAVANELRNHALDAPLIAQGDRARIQAGKVTTAATPAGTGQAIAQRIVAGGKA